MEADGNPADADDISRAISDITAAAQRLQARLRAHRSHEEGLKYQLMLAVHEELKTQLSQLAKGEPKPEPATEQQHAQEVGAEQQHGKQRCEARQPDKMPDQPPQSAISTTPSLCHLACPTAEPGPSDPAPADSMGPTSSGALASLPCAAAELAASAPELLLLLHSLEPWTSALAPRPARAHTAGAGTGSKAAPEASAEAGVGSKGGTEVRATDPAGGPGFKSGCPGPSLSADAIVQRLLLATLAVAESMAFQPSLAPATPAYSPGLQPSSWPPRSWQLQAPPAQAPPLRSALVSPSGLLVAELRPSTKAERALGRAEAVKGKGVGPLWLSQDWSLGGKQGQAGQCWGGAGSAPAAGQFSWDGPPAPPPPSTEPPCPMSFTSAGPAAGWRVGARGGGAGVQAKPHKHGVQQTGMWNGRGASPTARKRREQAHASGRFTWRRDAAANREQLGQGHEQGQQQGQEHGHEKAQGLEQGHGQQRRQEQEQQQEQGQRQEQEQAQEPGQEQGQEKELYPGQGQQHRQWQGQEQGHGQEQGQKQGQGQEQALQQGKGHGQQPSGQQQGLGICVMGSRSAGHASQEATGQHSGAPDLLPARDAIQVAEGEPADHQQPGTRPACIPEPTQTGPSLPLAPSRHMARSTRPAGSHAGTATDSTQDAGQTHSLPGCSTASQQGRPREGACATVCEAGEACQDRSPLPQAGCGAVHANHHLKQHDGVDLPLAAAGHGVIREWKRRRCQAASQHALYAEPCTASTSQPPCQPATGPGPPTAMPTAVAASTAVDADAATASVPSTTGAVDQAPGLQPAVAPALGPGPCPDAAPAPAAPMHRKCPGLSSQYSNSSRLGAGPSPSVHNGTHRPPGGKLARRFSKPSQNLAESPTAGHGKGVLHGSHRPLHESSRSEAAPQPGAHSARPGKPKLTVRRLGTQQAAGLQPKPTWVQGEEEADERSLRDLVAQFRREEQAQAGEPE
ncbi:hypothetical protein QJQ45_025708 [Haematococcus lacustris]|nr:hypothetical protein QJQ45_025708 [Haematococcus lacustris]